MRKFYLILAITFFVALVGSLLTIPGLAWYSTLTLPAWTPTGRVISWVWTTIYILTALAAVDFVRKSPPTGDFKRVCWLFLINAVLNAGWSFIFFSLHLTGVAVVEAVLLSFTVFLLVVLCWPVSRLSSLLLLPYLGWVSFATYLNYIVWQLNK